MHGILPGFTSLLPHGCVTLGKALNLSEPALLKDYGDDQVRMCLVCSKNARNGHLLKIFIQVWCTCKNGKLPFWGGGVFCVLEATFRETSFGLLSWPFHQEKNPEQMTSFASLSRYSKLC